MYNYPVSKFDPVEFAEFLARKFRESHPDPEPSLKTDREIEDFVRTWEPTGYWRKRLPELVWRALFPGVELPGPQRPSLF